MEKFSAAPFEYGNPKYLEPIDSLSVTNSEEEIDLRPAPTIHNRHHFKPSFESVDVNLKLPGSSLEELKLKAKVFAEEAKLVEEFGELITSTSSVPDIEEVMEHMLEKILEGFQGDEEHSRQATEFLERFIEVYLHTSGKFESLFFSALGKVFGEMGKFMTFINGPKPKTPETTELKTVEVKPVDTHEDVKTHDNDTHTDTTHDTHTDTTHDTHTDTTHGTEGGHGTYGTGGTYGTEGGHGTEGAYQKKSWAETMECKLKIPLKTIHWVYTGLAMALFLIEGAGMISRGKLLHELANKITEMEKNLEIMDPGKQRNDLQEGLQSLKRLLNEGKTELVMSVFEYFLEYGKDFNILAKGIYNFFVKTIGAKAGMGFASAAAVCLALQKSYEVYWDVKTQLGIRKLHKEVKSRENALDFTTNGIKQRFLKGEIQKDDKKFVEKFGTDKVDLDYKSAASIYDAIRLKGLKLEFDDLKFDPEAQTLSYKVGKNTFKFKCSKNFYVFLAGKIVLDEIAKRTVGKIELQNKHQELLKDRQKLMDNKKVRTELLGEMKGFAGNLAHNINKISGNVEVLGKSVRNLKNLVIDKEDVPFAGQPEIKQFLRELSEGKNEVKTLDEMNQKLLGEGYSLRPSQLKISDKKATSWALKSCMGML